MQASRPWSWVVGRPRLLDRLLVFALLLLGLPPVAARSLGGPPGAAALAFLLLLPQTVPLLWRRSRPVPVLLAVAAASAARLVLGRPETDLVLAVAVAVYSVSVYGPERERLVVAGVSVATVVLGAAGALLVGPRDPWSALLPLGAVSLAGWVVGDYLRTRRRYLADLELRARRLEQEAEQARQRAAEEERLRIARELHDVVAHQVSLMAIQAGAARVGGAREERAALASIEAGARETLAELNRLLGVLRRDGTPAARAPQPGLADLEPLLQAARDAGLRVRLEVTGTGRPLPPAVDLSAYRILQEAITNVLKHAGASQVDVRIHHGASALELTVVDDGSGPAGEPAGSGHGLIGMRERVELFGGSLEAGGSELGGFRVRARLPV